MSNAIETLKTENTLVIWNVGLPGVESSVESTPFDVYGYKWNLKLSRSRIVQTFPFVKFWEMSLYYSGNKASLLFPVNLYIRSGGKDIHLSQMEVNSANTVIWHCHTNDFNRQYPDIQTLAGTTLKFVLDFSLAIPDPVIPSFLKVDKSVQTYNESAEEHVCLEKLSFDLSKLVEDGSDPDVLLKCGEFSMGAHKLILGARSEVFRSMMKSDMKEGREGSVEIVDMEPKIFEVFIRYLYTGILPELTNDTALPLYEAADKYQLERLKKRLGKFLAENVSTENALSILVMADAHSDIDLKHRLVPHICEKNIPSTAAEWPKFCNQYPTLSIEVLNSYVKLLRSSQ